MDLQKAIYEFVVATIPVALVYFLGWAYLYFYFDSFGINIFELKLDLQAVFVYSYPPIRSVWSLLIGYGISASLVWIFIGLLVLILIKYVYFSLPPISNPALKRAIARSPIEKAAVFLLSLVIVLYFLIIPLAKRTALDMAGHLWDGDARQMVASISEDDYVDEDDQRWSWLKNYRRCQSRRELALIFANEDAYYMLCRSSDDKRTGLVFEVRRDSGLASVRYVNRV